jgi:hypothetical protein
MQMQVTAVPLSQPLMLGHTFHTILNVVKLSVVFFVLSVVMLSVMVFISKSVDDRQT